MSGGGTDFDAGLIEAVNAVTDVGTDPGDGIVVFLSDGQDTLDIPGQTARDQITDPMGLGQELRAFGIGASASLPSLQAIDPLAEVFADVGDFVDIFG